MQFEKKHEDMLLRIYASIVGDEYNEDGLIKRVCKIEKKQRIHANNFYIMYGILSLCILLITFYEKLKLLFSWATKTTSETVLRH